MHTCWYINLCVACTYCESCPKLFMWMTASYCILQGSQCWWLASSKPRYFFSLLEATRCRNCDQEGGLGKAKSFLPGLANTPGLFFCCKTWLWVEFVKSVPTLMSRRYLYTESSFSKGSLHTKNAMNSCLGWSRDSMICVFSRGEKYFFSSFLSLSWVPSAFLVLK